MTGVDTRPLWRYSAISLVVVVFAMVLLNSPVSATPLKLATKASDRVDIITSIESQELEDTLGLHNHNNNNVRLDNLEYELTTTSDGITTEEGPPPISEGLVASPGSANIRDVQELILAFPSRCPEGDQQDLSGKCRKPFAPEG